VLQRNVTQSKNETKVVSHLIDLSNNFVSALSIAVSVRKKHKFARTFQFTQYHICGPEDDEDARVDVPGSGIVS
jgi:hypothetical protein